MFNKEKYIVSTIQSVLNQTFNDFEIIIVDDGSTDNSLGLVNREFDSDKIRIIKKENGGPSSARNIGVKESRGEWIVFLDADDLLLPFALDYFNFLIQRNNNFNYFVCNYFLGSNCQAKLFSSNKYEGALSNPFFWEASRELSERPGSAVISKSLLLRYPFKENLRRYEDAECQYNLMRIAKIYLSSVPVMISDRDACCASSLRKHYYEDFVCNLDFKGKSFWEQISLYILALECKLDYPQQAYRLYRKIYNRVDYMIIYNYIRVRRKFKRLFISDNFFKEFSYEFLLSIKKIEDIDKLYKKNLLKK